MTETETTGKGRHPVARFVAVLSAFFCLLLATLYLTATIWLHTPSAARLASRLISDHLRYPVAVTGLRLTGRTVYIYGLTVGNPAKFKGGELASSQSITITPAWRTMLGGRKSFAEIAIRGLRVTLGRDGRGEWNFSELARLLSEKKGKGETSIKRLSISRSSFALEGLRLDDLALNVTDLSTRGTTGSRFLLTFKDAGGNPLRLEGNARLGGAPSLEAVFSAPSFSLQTLARTFGRSVGPDLGKGSGALSVTLKLQEGKLAARGRLGVRDLAIAVGNGRIPLQGDMEFAGGYDTKRDEASLDECSVLLNGIVRLKASAEVREVRKKRSFEAAVSLEGIDLKNVYAMLPRELRRDLAPGGTLSASVFRFSGDAANGITAGSCTFSLRGGEVAKGERLIVRDLRADASLARVKEGWRLGGRLSQGGGGSGAMLQAVNAPFSASFSSWMKPLSAELPSFSATISGLPATGKAGYRPGGASPLTFRLDIRKGAVSALNRHLAGKNVKFSGGTVSLSLQGSGRGPREFRGTIRGELADLRGSAGEKRFAARKGETGAEFSKSGGKLSATGRMSCSGAMVRERKVDFACSYRIGDGSFQLADGAAGLDRTELSFAGVSGPLPRPVRAGDATRFPLRLAWHGVSVKSGAVALRGLSGSLAADYVSEKGGRRLEGSGAVAAPHLVWKEGEIGSLDGVVRFTGSGAFADIHGKLLEGRLTGTASLDPFDPDRKARFGIHLEQASCARLAALAPAGLPVKPAAGVLDARVAGESDRKGGLRCRLETDGKGIALTGGGGKTVLADGRVRAVADYAGETLVIREGELKAGALPPLKATGELARPLAPDREGVIALSLSATPLDALLDTFVNLLPRGLQEASASGKAGMEGKLRISRRERLFEGALSLVEGGVEITAQKLSVAGMRGTIPLSLDFSGGAEVGKREKRQYSRENYPSLLSALRQEAKKGGTFAIRKVRFGGMELGETSLAIRAGKGLMEVTSLESTLFGGALLGEGFFRYGKNSRYGADLVVNDLSLRALCNANPKIRGYISGKVDGIVSLYGEGKGLEGVRGFTEIWTRSAPDEKRLVSKEFLQKLAGRKLKGIFFRVDRPYDRGEIRGYLANGYLTFDVLDISHTNFLGIRDLSVTVAPVQNRIALGHLISAIREAATRGKAVGEGAASAAPPIETEFKWEE